jgi:TRAP-type mannitol/chloroaromatic compound transport system substrate-binding protein
MTTFLPARPLFAEFAKLVADASQGRLVVDVTAADGDADPSKVVSDVRSGRVELGWGSFLLRSALVPAAQFLHVPFGLTPLEYSAWITHGGGRSLLDRIYEQVGCVAFPAGNTGMQMGGWFSKRIRTPDDLKGVTIRLSGIGNEAFRALGAEPVDLSPVSPEARRRLAAGEFDAYELGGPHADMRSRLHDRYGYYYYPAWHEPSVPFELFMGRETWQSLSPDLQAILQAAAAWLDQRWLLEQNANNAAALQTLQKEHGVELLRLPKGVLDALRRECATIAANKASQDALSQEVYASTMAFRDRMANWAMYSQHPYAETRI